MPASRSAVLRSVRGASHQFALFASVAVAFVALCAALAVAADRDDSTGRYIVVLEDSVDKPGVIARAQVESRDGKLGFVYRHALNGYSTELPKGAVESLRNDPRVAHMEPDVGGGVTAQTTPTGIDRIFATANEALDIDEADDRRVDADVAVFDTGIDAEHPDLNVVSQVDCNSEAPVCVEGGEDPHGHGTHVAGTIAALDNGEGVVGVAPGARLWSVKVLDGSAWGELSEFIAGIDWVTATREDEDPENDIEVANASLRYFTTSSYALTTSLTAAVEAGIVPVVAASNESEPVKYVPGNDPLSITVSAIADYDGQPGGGASQTCPEGSFDDVRALYSNYGNLVEIAAPGVCIYSTLPGGEYGDSSGTSMATPHVAGAAAILAGQESPENMEDVIAIRNTILAEGNSGWIDTSGDGIKEPLLDVSDEKVFSIPAVAPSATTETAAEVTAYGAKLRGNVNPNGFSTGYQFEYGTTTSYGSKAPASPSGIGSGGTGVEVSETVGYLEPNTTYHYRVAAANAGGTTYGEDKTLKTQELKAPTATTEAATNVTHGGAKLRGNVNPNGFSTGYQFEYGTTTSYGSKAPASPSGIGSGGTGVEVSETVGYLEPNTTYHYRVAAANAGGTTYGEDKTLKTQEAPESSEWEIRPTPNPNEEEGGEQSLTDVSCFSASMCLAVGSAAESEESPEALAEFWDGEEWMDVSPSSGAQLADVSCPLSSACATVGVKEGEAWAEVWNIELGWFLPMAMQSLPEATGSSLSGIDCLLQELPKCVAVGSYTEFGEERTLAMRWAGQEWEIVETPTEGDDSRLSAVSCNVVDSCVAVGSYTEFGEERPLAMHWDGEEWSLESMPSIEAEGADTYLNDVSCSGEAGPSTRCVAVGANENGVPQGAVAFVWNGEEWSVAAPTEPVGLAGDFSLHGVSCISESQCYAVGEYVGEEEKTKTLIEEWDGAEWSLSFSLNPEGSLTSGLRSVSCVAEDCAAVGFSSLESPARTDTLAMHRE